MVVNGASADEKACCYFAVGEPLGRQFCDLALLRSQFVEGVVLLARGFAGPGRSELHACSLGKDLGSYGLEDFPRLSQLRTSIMASLLTPQPLAE